MCALALFDTHRCDKLGSVVLVTVARGQSGVMPEGALLASEERATGATGVQTDIKDVVYSLIARIDASNEDIGHSLSCLRPLETLNDFVRDLEQDASAQRGKVSN